MPESTTTLAERALTLLNEHFHGVSDLSFTDLARATRTLAEAVLSADNTGSVKPESKFITVHGIRVSRGGYAAAPEPTFCHGTDDGSNCLDDIQDPCKACFLFDEQAGESRYWWDDLNGPTTVDETDSPGPRSSWTVIGTARQVGAIGIHERFVIEVDATDADDASDQARRQMADSGHEHVTLRTVGPTTNVRVMVAAGPIELAAAGVYVKDDFRVTVTPEGQIGNDDGTFAQFPTASEAAAYLENLGYQPERGD